MSGRHRPSNRIRPSPARHAALLVVVAVCLPVLAAIAAEEKPLTTDIVSATIYARQAQIVRSGEVALSPGAFRLVCGDLPEKFLATSLRVEGRGITGARIIGIDLRRMKEPGSDSPRYRELESEFEGLKAAREQLRIREAALSRRKQLAESVGKFSSDRGQKQLADASFSAGDWGELLGFFEEQDIELGRRLLELDKENDEINEQIKWVGSELNAMSAGPGRRKEVVIDCEITSPGVMTVELTYLVPNAEWHPEYTVRFIERDDEIELTYGTRISQATGEDWNDVSVLLSTSMPHVGAAPPGLLPHFLGMTTGTLRGRVTDAATGKALAWANVAIVGTPRGSATDRNGSFVISDIPKGVYVVQVSFRGYETKRRHSVRIVPGRSERKDFALDASDVRMEEIVIGAESTALTRSSGVVTRGSSTKVRPLSTASSSGKPKTPPAVPHVPAGVAETRFAANLVIPKPVTLETGAEPKRSLVVRERIPGRFVHEAVPRLSEHVFVRGIFENPLSIPLLPGSVQVYVESVPEGSSTEVSNFVGQEGLDAVAPGQKFAMHLGIDQNVKVEHELERKELLTRSKGKTRKMKYRFVIVAENFRRESVELWITDRVPTTLIRDVRIESVKILPEPDELEENGIIKWKLTVGPRERRELSIEYVVKYPSDMSAEELGLED